MAFHHFAKNAGLKSLIIFLHTFMQLNNQKSKTTILPSMTARKCQRRSSRYPYQWQITTRPHLNCQGFSLFLVDLTR